MNAILLDDYLKIYKMRVTAPIYQQHEENTSWTNSLKFYKDEIILLRERLAEIAFKNTNKIILAEVEHYQNQFIIQRNKIDEIMHAIKLNENALIKEINSNPIAVDHRKVAAHTNEAEQMKTFEKIFADLREKYNRFSSKWM
jgi:hypothetical protein